MVGSKFSRNNTRDDPTGVRDDVLRKLKTKKTGFSEV